MSQWPDLVTNVQQFGQVLEGVDDPHVGQDVSRRRGEKQEEETTQIDHDRFDYEVSEREKQNRITPSNL